MSVELSIGEGRGVGYELNNVKSIRRMRRGNDMKDRTPADEFLTGIGAKATVTFTSTQTGKHESLTMKSNWANSKADIIDEARGDVLNPSSNLVVAHIDREIRPFSVKLNKQQYTMTVAPGVDMALVAALCICLDDKHNHRAWAIAG